MSEADYRERFEDEQIQREMIKKSLSYIEAQKEFKAWKRQNKKAYREQLDDYIDEVRGY